MMKPLSIVSVFVLALFLLTACGRTPPANLYTLEFAHSGVLPSSVGQSAISVGLRQVTLPAVLKQPQIVLIEEGQVKQQEFQRWSEPLDEAMLRVLSYELRSRLNSSSILSYPWPSAFEPEQTLSINVVRFSGLPGKNVELVGVWLLSRRDDPQTVRAERFHIVEKVEEGGYSSLVKAHSGALNQLADQLVKVLTAQN